MRSKQFGYYFYSIHYSLPLRRGRGRERGLKWEHPALSYRYHHMKQVLIYSTKHMNRLYQGCIRARD
jgi:hypothetical protein